MNLFSIPYSDVYEYLPVLLLFLSQCPPEDEQEPLSLGHLVTCSRCINGDLSLLAATLDIPDEEMALIKSKYKTTNGQALQMLKRWQSTGAHTKQELVDILHNVDFPQAAQW